MWKVAGAFGVLALLLLEAAFVVAVVVDAEATFSGALAAVGACLALDAGCALAAADLLD